MAPPTKSPGRLYQECSNCIERRRTQQNHHLWRSMFFFLFSSQFPGEIKRVRWEWGEESPVKWLVGWFCGRKGGSVIMANPKNTPKKQVDHALFFGLQILRRKDVWNCSKIKSPDIFEVFWVDSILVPSRPSHTYLQVDFTAVTTTFLEYEGACCSQLEWSIVPWKLTCPLKINGWKMCSLLKQSLFAASL